MPFLKVRLVGLHFAFQMTLLQEDLQNSVSVYFFLFCQAIARFATMKHFEMFITMLNAQT